MMRGSHHAQHVCSVTASIRKPSIFGDVWRPPALGNRYPVHLYGANARRICRQSQMDGDNRWSARLQLGVAHLDARLACAPSSARRDGLRGVGQGRPVGDTRSHTRPPVSGAGTVQGISGQVHGSTGDSPQGRSYRTQPTVAECRLGCSANQLYKHDWVVCAKTPLGGPAQVLEYLSRYTHRTAICNERIHSVSKHEVVFSVRANDKGSKRLERVEGGEFVRRFMQHVLPTGIKRIRHYGVLA